MLFGFLVVVIPLVCFLYYSNYYAMEVVKKQVAQSNLNLLSLHTQAMDKTLSEIDNYLYKIATSDVDFKTLTIMPQDSEEYVYSRIMMKRKFTSDNGYYHLVDTFFVYSENKDDLMSYHQLYDSDEVKIKESLIRNLLKEPVTYKKWYLVKSGSTIGLVRVVQSYENMFVGAWISASKLIEPLGKLDFGEEGQAVLLLNDGSVLSPAPFIGHFPDQAFHTEELTARQYGVIHDDSIDRSYMYIVQPYAGASLNIMVLFPERDILMHLPFFQRTTVIIPVITALLVLLYVALLKKIVLRPIAELIRGLRKIRQGDYNVRLLTRGSGEITFLIDSFNYMASEIESTKIAVYEEKLRLQQAEFKHLQMQIKPHFYLNTLNVIHSLAFLKNYTGVQKLTKHLADYFRFTIRTERQFVTLEEECKLVEHYLEIQKVRFPDLFSYSMFVSEETKVAEIPQLAIQPFVENAMIHGFKEEGEAFHIGIEIAYDKESGKVFIRIADSGVGFDEKTLRGLQNGEYFNIQGKCIGIWNVYHRLKLYFGEETFIQFQNGDSYGAEVAIVIPYRPVV
jgi:two-component system sensor histidine kinase YesM